MTLPAQTQGRVSVRPRPEAFEVERRRAFLAGLVLASLSALVTAGLAAPGSFDRVAGLLLGIMLAVGALVSVRSPRIPDVARIGVPLLVAAYLGAKMGDVLVAYAGMGHFEREIAQVTPWGPVLLIMTWILFDPGRVLWTIVGAYYVAVTAPAVFVGIARGTRYVIEALDIMGPFLLASLTATVLLGVLTQVRRQYAEAQRARETLGRMAHTDPLTGLPNRRALMAELTREVAVAARSGAPLGIILFDLDRFKDVNDIYGHQTGDEVLVAAAHRARRRLRATDLVGRWGGEEFLILAPGDDLEQAAHLAEDLRRALSERPMTGDRARLTASLGVTVYQRGDTTDTILARVDAALYQAKRQGRNRVARAGLARGGAVEGRGRGNDAERA